MDPMERRWRRGPALRVMVAIALVAIGLEASSDASERAAPRGVATGAPRDPLPAEAAPREGMAGGVDPARAGTAAALAAVR